MNRVSGICVAIVATASVSGCAVYSQPYPATVSGGYYVASPRSFIVPHRYDAYRSYRYDAYRPYLYDAYRPYRYDTYRPYDSVYRQRPPHVHVPPSQVFVPRHDHRDTRDWWDRDDPRDDDRRRYDRRERDSRDDRVRGHPRAGIVPAGEGSPRPAARPAAPRQNEVPRRSQLPRRDGGAPAVDERRGERGDRYGRAPSRDTDRMPPTTGKRGDGAQRRRTRER